MRLNRCRDKPVTQLTIMNLSQYTTMDPHLLVGLVNTELRNNATSLSDLCKTHALEEERLISRLAAGDYHWRPEQKQFR